jgi:hypothetical protein
VFELELCGLVLLWGCFEGVKWKEDIRAYFPFWHSVFRGAMGVSADYGLEFIY